METAQSVSEAAHELADQLPVNATWDDLVYKVIERREIELGLSDSAEGKVTSVEDVMKEFGIQS